MSGEVVVVSVFGVGAVGAAGLIAAIQVGSLVYQEVQARIAERNRQNLLRAQQIQQEWERWNAEQLAQGRAMEAAAQRWQEIGRRVGEIAPPGQAPEIGEQAGGKGFLQHAREKADQAGRLDELARYLDEVPEALSRQAGGALEGLRQGLAQLQRQQAEGPPPLASAIDSFQAAMAQTLADQAAALALEPQRLARRMADAADLLGRLTSLEALADAGTAAEVAALSAALREGLERGRLEAAEFADLNDRVEALVTRVLREHQDRLVEEQLSLRLAHHLADLGYRHLGSEAGAERWAIPGGEQVLARLQPGLRMAFQLQHERFEGRSASADLDHAELRLLRQQEQRWCADLKTLVGRLQQDGFPLRPEFERLIPEESIPVVMVEDVDDILRQQADQPELKRHDLD